MELINNLIEKYYREKKSIFLTIVISVLLGVLLFSAVENIVYKIIGIIFSR